MRYMGKHNLITAHSISNTYTVSQNTLLLPYILNNSEANEPILLISDVRNQDKISHKNIVNLLISPA